MTISMIIFLKMSFVINNNDDILNEKDESLIKGMILLSCSILGKHAIENNNKRITKTIKEFSELYEYEFNEAYNIVNLMMIKNCKDLIDRKTALDLISNKIKPSRNLHSFLNIIGISSIYEKYAYKDQLFDELENLNKELMSLEKNLGELKEKKKNEEKIEQRKQYELKKKIEKKEELINKFKDGVQFNHPDDPSKQIKITPNEREFNKCIKNINEELDLDENEEKCYYENVKGKDNNIINNKKGLNSKENSINKQTYKSKVNDQESRNDLKDIHRNLIENKLKNNIYENDEKEEFKSIKEYASDILNIIGSTIMYLPEIFIPGILFILMFCVNFLYRYFKAKNIKSVKS